MVEAPVSTHVHVTAGHRSAGTSPSRTGFFLQGRRETRTRPSVCGARAGSREPSPGKGAGEDFHYEKTPGAVNVPHRTSGVRSELHHA
jgi:hypothetical protein